MHIKRVLQSIRRTAFSNHRHALIEAQKSFVPMPTSCNTACMNFMIDFELIWGNGKIGAHDHSISKRINDAKKQHENFQPFINLIEKLNFPTSWALLGKLVDHKHELNAAEKFNPSWCKQGDWYNLPKDIAINDNLVLGKNYIDNIMKLTAPKEILSHGHAHIDYSDIATTLSVAKKDLELSLQILNQINKQNITSFVYPCNKQGHKELLIKNGIKVIRGESHHWKTERDLIETPLGFWISPGAMSFKELLPHLENAITNKCWIHPWMHLIECDLKTNDIDNFYRPLFEWSLEQELKGKLIFSTFSKLPSIIKS